MTGEEDRVGAEPNAGESLRAWVGRGGPVPVRRAVDAILLACVSVAEGHARGRAFGDLHPDRLFWAVRDDGERAVDVDSTGVPSRRTLAAIFYEAPEQLVSPPTFDERSDVWALGATLFHLLTARDPFGAEERTELLARVLRDDTPSVRDLRPSVPAALEFVVRRCLEKDADDRYADVAELGKALALFGSERSIPKDAVIAGVLAGEAAPPAMALAVRRPRSSFPPAAWAETARDDRHAELPPPPAPPRRRLLRAAVALAIVAAAPLGIVALARQGCARPEPGSAAQTASITTPSPRVSTPPPGPSLQVATPPAPPAPSNEAHAPRAPHASPGRNLGARPAPFASPGRAFDEAPARLPPPSPTLGAIPAPQPRAAATASPPRRRAPPPPRRARAVEGAPRSDVVDPYAGEAPAPPADSGSWTAPEAPANPWSGPANGEQ